MTPEGKVRAHLRRRAKALGFEHRKLQWIGRRGAPDEFLFWPTGALVRAAPWTKVRAPFAVYVEVKRLGETPEAHQQREIDRLRDAGFLVYVVDSPEAVDAMLAALTAALGVTS